MTLFTGTHINRLDAKGRVSIPAPFRAVLKANDDGVGKLILRPSHLQPCVEGWTLQGFSKLTNAVQRMDLFSDDQDALGFTLFGEATELEPDREGRIVLPDLHAAFAGVTDSVGFVGCGNTFQIWDPAIIARRRAEALALVKARQLVLRGEPA
jgi:MraZ protein